MNNDTPQQAAVDTTHVEMAPKTISTPTSKACPIEDQEPVSLDKVDLATKPLTSRSPSTASSIPKWGKMVIAFATVAVISAAIALAVVFTIEKDKNHAVGPVVIPQQNDGDPTYNKYVDSKTGYITDPVELAKFGGFSSLRLVSFLPSSETVLHQRQAITLVFSKSVIALGSNFDDATQVPPATIRCDGAAGTIPGKWRWVTTSIARFDPDIDWPTDLHCDASVKMDLTSWDGISLNTADSTSMTRRYTTPAFTADIHSVFSQTASDLTSNTWNAYLADRTPECPPDAQISLYFSGREVEVDYVVSKIQVMAGVTISSSVKFVQNGTCDGTPSPKKINGRTFSTCIRGYISNGGLPAESTYLLQLPAGITPTQYGGKLSKNILLPVNGLLPFRFDFKTSRWSLESLNSRSLRLYLAHGLHPATSLSALKSSITVSVNGAAKSFTLTRPRLYELLLRVDTILPDDRVSVIVSSNSAVRDGFNLPLVASSQAFKAQSTESEIFDLQRTTCIVFPKSRVTSQNQWPLFGRPSSPGFERHSGSCNADATATYDALPDANLEDTIARYGYEYQFSYPYTPAKQVYSANSVNTRTFINISNTVANLVDAATSKVAVREFNPNGCYTNGRNLILGGDVVLTTIATPGRLSVHASNLFTMAPTAGINVKLLGAIRYTSQSRRTPQTATTDANGLATFPITKDEESLILIATMPDGSLSVTRNIVARKVTKTYVGSSTSDKGIYKLGEKVFVTGVLKQKSNNNLNGLATLAENTALTAKISWTNGNQSEYTAKTNKFGTFSFRFTVPHNADYTQQTLQVVVNDERYKPFAQVEFVVADPRIPSGVLSLAPSGLPIHVVSSSANAFPISVTAKTYSGHAVAKANVTIKVSITRASKSSSLSVTRGSSSSSHNSVVGGSIRYENEVHILTDATGSNLNFNIPLPDAADGETASISATWVGPTRELLVKSLSVPIRSSLLTISGEKENLVRAIPGVPYNLDVTVNATNEVDKSFKLPSKLVVVTLRLFKTVRSATTAFGSFSWEKVASSTAVASFTCTLAKTTTSSVSAADFRALCPITLPSMGVFAVELTTSDSLKNDAVSTLLVGEPQESWALYPLRSQYPITARFSSTEGYARGSTLDVIFNNPYPYTAKALYMCTDSSSDLKTFSVPSGTSTLQLPSTTCDCPNVGITILTPETTSPVDKAAFTVPISSVADFNAPTHFDWDLTPVCSAAKPDIALTVAPEAATTTPGSELSVDVTSVDANGQHIEAEVTLMVVDKAVLDLNAPTANDEIKELRDNSYWWNSGVYYGGSFGQIARVARGQWWKDDQRDDYLSPNYNAAMKRRIGEVSNMDPWLKEYQLKDKNKIHMNASLAGVVNSRFDLTTFPYVWEPSLPFGYIDPNNQFYERTSEYDMVAMEASGGAMDDGAVEKSAPASPPSASSPSTSKKSSGIQLRSDSTSTTTAIKIITTSATTGKATVSIPFNAKVGTWVIRAVAVRSTGSQPLATTETNVVSKKALQIVPSLPRLVRYGDNFTAGVVATAVKETSATVTVTHVCRGLKLVSPSASQTLTVASNSPREVLFSFDTINYDTDCRLEFTIVDNADSTNTDGISAQLPVYAPLPSVSVGTSFVLRDEMQWNEGFKYPAALPGGRVNITTAVGRLAAIEDVTSTMLERHDRQPQLYGPDLLDRIASFIALFPYASNGATTMSDHAVQSATLATSSAFAASKVAFYDALDSLKSYCSPATGLRYSQKVPHYKYVDLHLNFRAMHLLRTVLRAKLSTSSSQHLLHRSALNDIISQIEVAVLSELQSMMIYPPTYPDAHLSALLYYGFGATAVTNDRRFDRFMNVVVYSLDVMVNQRDKLGLNTRAYLFSAIIQSNVHADAHAPMVSEFMDSIRVTGRTAFIAYGGSGNSPGPAVSAVLFQAITAARIMSARITSLVDQQLIEKISNYVSQTEPLSAIGSNQWFYNQGGDAEEMLALSFYDVAHRVTNPAITVKTINNTAIIKSVPYVGTDSLRHVDEQSYLFTQLQTKSAATSTVDSSLKFSSTGTGEASVVVSLNFVPQLPVINKPRYFGLFMEKSVAIISGAHAGKQLNGVATPLAPGDLVKVTLAVTTADDVQSISITDFDSGGLEPVNAALSGVNDLLDIAQAAETAIKTQQERLDQEGRLPSAPETSQPMMMPMMSKRSAKAMDYKMPSSAGYSSSATTHFGPWWWMWYFQFMVEVKSDRVVCSGYSPRAGTYECTYFATATTSGDFVVPAAEAVVLDQPEVMGMSTYLRARVNPKK